MITDDEVMRLFEQADPARTTDDHNNTPDATGYLAALRTRSNNVTYIDTNETSTEQPNHRRWYMTGAAVAAVAIVVVGGLVLLTGNEDATEPEIPATVPPTVAPTTTQVVPVEDAVGRAEAFLGSIEQRNVSLVEEQLGEGFTARSSFPGEDFGEPSTFASNGWLDLRYQVVTGTSYADPVCSLVSQDAAASVVECETALVLAAHRITNTPGVSAVVTMSVSEAGIATMDSALGSNLGLLSFERWKEANWPAEVPLDDEIESFEDLLAFASTEEQLAEDWVAFAIDSVEATFVDYNAGNLDDFLARFEGNRFTNADDETVAALMAGSSRHEQSDCEPVRVESRGLIVVCDLVIEHMSFATSGVQVDGAISFVVAPDGSIAQNSNTVVWEPSINFNTAFKRWMQEAHADVHDQVEWLDEVQIASADDQATVAQYYEEFVAQSDVYPLGG